MATNFEELRRRADLGDHAALMKLAEELDRAQRPVETIEVLSRAANRGNVHARFMVAVRLLIGYFVPVRAHDAVRLLSESSDQGHADATAVLAVLAGIGAYVEQDFDIALDLLARAAQLGSVHARAQLAVLSGDRVLADAASRGNPPADFWARLRKTIDAASWTRAPKVVLLSESPRVGIVENFVSAEICDWAIARSRGRLTRAEIYNAVSKDVEVSETRSNTTALFGLLETDLVMAFIQARMSAATGIPFDRMEAPAVLHYDPGEQITEHYDFVDPATPDYDQEIAGNGQRICTFLVYLNDDYEGGETEFPKLGISHKGKKGEGLFFINANAEGRADIRTEHAGRPPARGEKWIISQFIRSRPSTPGRDSDVTLRQVQQPRRR
ncbi:MAG: 2OG-Fe(II) oxygenase [Alphaproteobacteria bacterium]